MELQLLLLENEPIFSQLQLEEALLRADDANWCIINKGSTPAIVLGVSGNPVEFIDSLRYAENPIPVIRRFSGGGTVVVDANTLFVSFIISKNSLDFGVRPSHILEWTKELYKPVFHPLPFSYKENDYTLENRKIGGNAHYFTKDRWLHHTSFLWDYDETLMSYLLMPKKRPRYRDDRAHGDFVQRLCVHFDSCCQLLDRLITTLNSTYAVTQRSRESILLIKERPHRKSVEMLNCL